MRALRQTNTNSGNGSDQRADQAEKPDLIVDNGDLPATAHELRDLLARSDCIFDRGVPVKVVPSRDGSPPLQSR
jgi:hypothetical protein